MVGTPANKEEWFEFIAPLEAVATSTLLSAPATSLARDSFALWRSSESSNTHLRPAALLATSPSTLASPKPFNRRQREHSRTPGFALKRQRSSFALACLFFGPYSGTRPTEREKSSGAFILNYPSQTDPFLFGACRTCKCFLLPFGCSTEGLCSLTLLPLMPVHCWRFAVMLYV